MHAYNIHIHFLKIFNYPQTAIRNILLRYNRPRRLQFHKRSITYTGELLRETPFARNSDTDDERHCLSDFSPDLRRQWRRRRGTLPVTSFRWLRRTTVGLFKGYSLTASHSRILCTCLPQNVLPR